MPEPVGVSRDGVMGAAGDPATADQGKIAVGFAGQLEHPLLPALERIRPRLRLALRRWA
jgi:hypothetical protein